MAEEKFKLYNRYHANIYLEFVSDGVYKLTADKQEDLDYVRVGYDNNAEKAINFVDPSGGPFMQVGSLHLDDGRILQSIDFEKDKGYIFTFK